MGCPAAKLCLGVPPNQPLPSWRSLDVLGLQVPSFQPTHPMGGPAGDEESGYPRHVEDAKVANVELNCNIPQERYMVGCETNGQTIV